MSGEIQRITFTVDADDYKKMNEAAKKALGDKSFSCQFNPESYSTSYAAKMSPRPGVIQNSDKKVEGIDPKLDYEGAEKSKEIELELTFDTTQKWHGDTSYQVGDDVEKAFVGKFLALMEPMGDASQEQPRPPRFTVTWGSSNFGKRNDKPEPYFLRCIDIDYLLFDSSGTALRATVKLTLTRELEMEKGQNPTTRSIARKLWVVEAGQTLDWIAHQEYGDSNYWRYIAQINNLANPRKLRPGQILNVPPL